MTLPLNIPHIMTARALLERDQLDAPRRGEGAPRWSFEELGGSLIEIVEGRAPAALSFCSSLISQAQRADVPLAWLTSGESLFFPADMRQNGVDVGALAIVRLGAAAQMLRAADALIRSGAFGLLLVDGGAALDIHPSQQQRLSRMAKKYGVVVVFLRAHLSARVAQMGKTRAKTSARSSRYALKASLQVEASWERAAQGHFGCTLRAIKDRRCAPGWRVQEVRRGTPGLR